MSVALKLSLEEQLTMALKNDGDLYLFAMGWLAEQYRGDRDKKEVATGIGITGAGYALLESGSSGNYRTWCRLWEYHGKDIVSIQSMCRAIVREIQAREGFRGSELSPEERRDVAKEISDIMKL